ncbi:SOS response-associated peptidase [Salisediminibacterium selenitireducens]|uniref:Abasic site processing protein n=1 Tax=Bacillus selenitireducens (strain ATCC 700615 / DSM 15326 / MLS10) TaxID=439292 RepID=D6XX81_BACIE|nr:SOS response-associated peptidase [Salisediminibacterium selenitireducens]ADH97938.1 protein of unknown function DUF159 [[Bacillus] selenitireducens MLS10]
MCGRFSLYHQPNLIARRFELDNLEAIALDPRYNIAPSQDILAIVHDGKTNRAGFLRWGLIPSFAKDPKIGSKMINARAETLYEKPSFAKLLTRRRCIIPANGFFEWQKTETGKVPMHIQLRDGEPFAMAGLWDRWQDEGGETITSCTIITTEPNTLMAPIHNRMPAILTRDQEAIWLDRRETGTDRLKSLLTPFDSRQMTATAVSSLVNSPKHDSPTCIAPIPNETE